MEGPTGSNGDMLRFTNSLYRDDTTGNTFLFGEIVWCESWKLGMSA